VAAQDVGELAGRHGGLTGILLARGGLFAVRGVGQLELLELQQRAEGAAKQHHRLAIAAAQQ
jgi:hypothetical protein